MCTREQVDLCLNPASAYLVDVLHAQSAEVMSATKCVHTTRRSRQAGIFHADSRLFLSALRTVLAAVATSAVLPAIESFGLLWTDLVGAVIGWSGFL